MEGDESPVFPSVREEEFRQVEGDSIEIGGRAWRLVNALQPGGYGRVWKVESEGTYKALKSVKNDPGSEMELHINARVRDLSSIVPLESYRELDGNWLLLMPLADESLADYLKRFEFPAKTGAIGILHDIAVGLRDVASRGVVHRDLKPGNVLLLDGRWRLSDFGISQHTGATVRTHTRNHLTTEAYKSPEQWRGEPATAASDIYAFGVLAFELISGGLPFNGRYYDHAQRQKGVSDIPSVSPALSRIVQRCLAYDAPSRPDPQKVVDELTALLSPSVHRREYSDLRRASFNAVERERAAAQADALRDEQYQQYEVHVESARQSFQAIIGDLFLCIHDNAPDCQISHRADPGNGYSAVLEMGALEVSPLRTMKFEARPIAVSAENGVSKEVRCLAWATIAVRQQSARDGWNGHARSLWYCDVERRGYYDWYEFSFIPSRPPFIEAGNGLFSPSNEAVGPALYAPVGVAPTRAHQYWISDSDYVSGRHQNSFVDRWAMWMGQAANETLEPPADILKKRSEETARAVRTQKSAERSGPTPHAAKRLGTADQRTLSPSFPVRSVASRRSFPTERDRATPSIFSKENRFVLGCICAVIAAVLFLGSYLVHPNQDHQNLVYGGAWLSLLVFGGLAWYLMANG